jgi:hypothetical protein
MIVKKSTILISFYSLLYNGAQCYFFTPPFAVGWIFLVIALNTILLGLTITKLRSVYITQSGNVLCPTGMSIMGFTVFYPATTFVMFNQHNQITAERLYGITSNDFMNMGLDLTLTLVGLIIFWLVFSYALNYNAKSAEYAENRKDTEGNIGRYKRVACIIYLIGILPVILWLGGPIEWMKGTFSSFTSVVETGERMVGQEGYRLVEILNGTCSIGIIVYLFIVYSKVNSRLGLIIAWLVAGILSFIAFGYIASRTMVLLFAVWIIIVHSIVRKKIPFKASVIYGSLLITMAILIKFVMFLPWVDGMVSLENINFFLFDSPAIPFIMGFDLSRMLPTVVLFHYNLVEGWHWGTTYIAAFVHLIPNILWPFERPLNIEQEASLRAGIDIFSKHSNPIVGMVGESLYNFGLLGAVLLGMVLGRLVVWLQKIYERFLVRRAMNDGVLIVLCMMLCFSLSATQSHILLYQIFIYTVIYCIYLIVSKLNRCN